MKKCLLLFGAILLVQLTSLAQQGWFWQNPLPQGNPLEDIYVFDENTAIAVGGVSTVIKTTDGGTSWNVQHYAGGTTERLFSVHFTNNNTGWAVGDNGTILKTTNGGTNWNPQTSGMGWRWLHSVHFTDNNTGWAVGRSGKILKTTDGGTNWNSQTSGTIYGLLSVHFTDNNTGWAVGGYAGHPLFVSVVLNTTDGGTNWILQTSGTTKALRSVHFTDNNTGWAVGWDGIILNTTDGGTNWSSQTSGTTQWLESVHFTDDNTGWAVGTTGTILNTTDGGTNWNPQTSGTLKKLCSVHFTDNNTGWVVGGQPGAYSYDDSGIILKTITGGVIPVDLTSFTASTSRGKIFLNWSTATELNNLGFEVERKIINNDKEGQWVTLGFKEGAGTTTEPMEYSYVDDISSITAASLAYRLKQIDFNGSYEYSDEVLIEVEIPIPLEFALHQNFPNPFNPVTTINYSLPVKSQVELVIYNALGERLKRLVSGEKDAGYHKVEFNAKSLPSGVYFYHLKAGDYVATKKMILIK